MPPKPRDWPLTPEQEPPPGAEAIRLTKGWVAWVDEADYDALAPFNWFAERPGNRTAWYASRSIREGGRRKSVRMHRLVVSPPSGMEVDHREHYPLLRVVDNRRANLRACTKSQNGANGAQRRTPGQYSPFIGVTRSRHGGKWIARIKGPSGWPRYVKSFREEWHAALARDLEAYKRYGEFARLNFNIPKPGEPRFLPVESPANALTF